MTTRQTKLEPHIKKKIFTIEDLVREINLKLDHLIEIERYERYSMYKIYPETHDQGYQ